MKRIISGVLCVIVLAGVSRTASAVPVYFEFTGSITGTMGSYAASGLEGTAISGGFYFETDGLTQDANPWSTVYSDPSASGVFASLNFGTTSITFPIHPEANVMSMAFRDFCDGSLCDEPYLGDAIELYASTSTVPFETRTAPGFVGQFFETKMTVTAYQYRGDFLDAEQVVPTDLVSLPLPEVFGGYSERLYTCNGGGGCNIPVDNGVSFAISSVSRGVDVRSVPEPGTLGLSVAAGFGLLLLGGRRRVIAPSQRQQ